jgi:signal transduction histidine kinase
VVLAALIGGLFLLDSNRGPAEPDAGYPAIDLAVGVAGCLALLLRRRWPVGVAAALIPSLVLSASTMGPTAVAMFAVARYRTRVVTAAVLAAHAVTVTVLFGLVAPDRPTFWQGLLVVLSLDVAMVASGLLVRSQHLLVQSVRERASQAEEGHRLRVEEARHHERERIAREMHDVLADRLSLLAVHAGALEVRRSAPEEERRAAGVIRQSAYQALEDLREVIGMLRDAPGGADADHPQPTMVDVPALIEQSRLACTPVTFDTGALALATLPEGVGRHAYRIIQEGLTNARKHAVGAPVAVRLAGSVADPPTGGCCGTDLIIEVTNPVPAGAPVLARIPGAGSGLIGLRERVGLVGGELEHGRTADGGFRLYARLPVRP